MADFITNLPAVINYAAGVFTPRANNNGESVYSAELIWDKNDPGFKAELERMDQAFKDAYEQGRTRSYTNRNGQQVNPPFQGMPEHPADLSALGIQLPIRDADTYVIRNGQNAGRIRAQVNPEYQGKAYMRVSTRRDLAAENALLDEQSRRPLDRGSLYSGALVRVKLWLTAYVGNDGSRGIKPTLIAVLKTGDGTPLVDRVDTDPFSGFGLTPVDPLQNMGSTPAQAPAPAAGTGFAGATHTSAPAPAVAPQQAAGADAFAGMLP